MQLDQKTFILEACKGMLAEIDHPAVDLYQDLDGDGPAGDVMSPTAMATPPVDRFVCRLLVRV